MTQLICLVQRLSLGDEQRTLIKEGERFDVDAKAAAIYIKGGIAVKSAEQPEPVVKLTEPEPEPAPVETPEPEPEPEKEIPKGGKKKGR